MNEPPEAGKYLCQVYDYIDTEARDKYGWGTHWQIKHFNKGSTLTGFLGEELDWPVLHWTYLPPLPKDNRGIE